MSRSGFAAGGPNSAVGSFATTKPGRGDRNRPHKRGDFIIAARRALGVSSDHLVIVGRARNRWQSRRRSSARSGATVASNVSVPGEVERRMLYPVMAAPPLSASDHDRRTRPPSRFALRNGVPGMRPPRVGSKALKSLRPPDCRAMAARAVYEFPVAVGAARTQSPPAHPSAYATRTRPSWSICTSMKSRRFRQIFAPPAQPDAAALHGVVRRRVHRRPGRSAIIRWWQRKDARRR